jgi:NADH-quinone oxidoreductase subunit K
MLWINNINQIIIATNNYSGFLVLGFLFFFAGFSQFLFIEEKNFLSILIAAELMLLGSALLFLHSYLYFFALDGLTYAFLLTFVVVAETGIGLSLAVLLLKNHKTLELKEIDEVKL